MMNCFVKCFINESALNLISSQEMTGSKNRTYAEPELKLAEGSCAVVITLIDIKRY